MSSIADVINNVFHTKRILVVGDLVADQFLRGNIGRVSREAPVFILQHENTETLCGGAANAAANVCSLGAKSTVVGVVGSDENGIRLKESLSVSNVDLDGVVTIAKGFQTTTKLRVLAGQQYARRQQVIRIDYENSSELEAETQKQLETEAVSLLSDCDALIISDYGYGVATESLGKLLIKKAKEARKPVLVDSRNNLQSFKGATAATPNKEELEGSLGKKFSLQTSAELRQLLETEALLVTLGNEGMCLLQDNREPVRFPVVGKTEPVDVTGAGDTVIAVFALCIASGLDFPEAARVANHAGGIVVMKKATASVTAEELLDSIVKHEPELLDIALKQAS